jgi:hypothetical protein
MIRFWVRRLFSMSVVFDQKNDKGAREAMRKPSLGGQSLHSGAPNLRLLVVALVLCLGARSAAARTVEPPDDVFCAPYQAVDVRVTPVFETPQINDRLSLRELQTVGSDPRTSIPQRETFRLGMTHYTPEVSFHSQLLKRPMHDGSYCVRVERVEVTMGYRDVQILIANEFTADACAFNHVLEHENKHVRVNADLLNEFTVRAKARLTEILRQSGVARVPTEAFAEQLIRDRLHAELESLASAMLDENRRRQALVDTPEEYARNDTACGGVVQAITRRAAGR